MRACAHDYAERLGLDHTSIVQGEGKAVRVSMKRDQGAGSSEPTEAASGSAKKRKAAGDDSPGGKLSAAEAAERRAKKKACAPRGPPRISPNTRPVRRPLAGRALRLTRPSHRIVKPLGPANSHDTSGARNR